MLKTFQYGEKYLCLTMVTASTIKLRFHQKKKGKLIHLNFFNQLKTRNKQ